MCRKNTAYSGTMNRSKENKNGIKKYHETNEDRNTAKRWDIAIRRGKLLCSECDTPPTGPCIWSGDP